MYGNSLLTQVGVWRRRRDAAARYDSNPVIIDTMCQAEDVQSEMYEAAPGDFE